jgi:hypothetical protein
MEHEVAAIIDSGVCGGVCLKAGETSLSLGRKVRNTFKLLHEIDAAGRAFAPALKALCVQAARGGKTSAAARRKFQQCAAPFARAQARVTGNPVLNELVAHRKAVATIGGLIRQQKGKN